MVPTELIFLMRVSAGRPAGGFGRGRKAGAGTPACAHGRLPPGPANVVGMSSAPAFSVALLADHPALVSQVGEMRWGEWGHGETSLQTWTDVTAREAGRTDLPITLVALDGSGRALGAVGLGLADGALTEEERQLRGPWLLGLVVRADQRHLGVGRRLVVALEGLARDRGCSEVWVATGSDAREFYQRCGWVVRERLVLAHGGWTNDILCHVL